MTNDNYYLPLTAVKQKSDQALLLQHNSSRPISDKLIAKAFPAILEYTRVQPVETD